MNKSTSSGPFALAAADYFDAGWCPVPCRGKQLLVKGVTGRNGREVRSSDIDHWLMCYKQANIAIRLPRWLIGIDVDVYNGGDHTYSELVWGGLSDITAGPRITARTDGSGIYLCRIPEGTELRGTAGQGVDVIQWFHRYVMVPRSVHPETSTEYKVLRGGYEVQFLSLSLPGLPDEWIEYLSIPARSVDSGAVAAPGAAREWWKRIAGGSMCELMEEAAARAVLNLAQADISGGLHDEMCQRVWELTHYAAEGHLGLAQAIRQVQIVFTSSHRKRPLVSEWKRALVNAVCDAASREQESADPCDELAGWD